MGSSFKRGTYFLNDQGNDENTTLESIVVKGHTLNISEAVHVHETVVYLGVILGLWGHFLTDSMRMMWFLKSDEFCEKFSDNQIIYISGGTSVLEGNRKRMLEILGVNCSDMKCVAKLTKYDRIILPDECFFQENGHSFFTQEYKAMIDTVRNFSAEHSDSDMPKKVYYSYSGYRHDRTVGEDKLERYFSSKGYEIIHPEKFSLDEQLDILRNCESFASTVGSVSHNTIFLPDNTEVILIPRANYLTSYQLALNQIHNLRINFIDSSFSIFIGEILNAGPFLYFISSNLRKYFHDEDISAIVSVSDFKKYLRICFGYTLGRPVAYADNPNVYKYYISIAPEYFSRLFHSSWLVRLKKWLKSVPALRQFFKRLIR